MTDNRFILLKKYRWLLPVVSIFICIVIVVLMCTTPPVDRDGLTHHLAVPKLYIKHGGIHEIHDIEFSYYPQLVDLLYAVPLFFSNDIFPKYIHFMFALLTSMYVFKMLRRRSSLFISISGALFFLTVPVIVRLSVSVYVDLGLFFFSFASMYYLLKWFSSGHDNVISCQNPDSVVSCDNKGLKGLKYLVLSAVSCGFAMSCKYNGLIVFLLMSFSVLWISSKKHRTKKAASEFILFCIISIGVFSPWLIKNYIWTGNPVYPLYNSLFNPSEIKNTEPDSGKKSHFYYRRVIFGESLAETISTPVRIFFQGKDDDPKFFDGVLNPLLFFMPLVSVLIELKRCRKKEAPDYEKILLFVFSWAFILFVYVQTDMRTRWAGPAIAPLVVLSFIGIDELWRIAESKAGYSGVIIKSVFFASVFAMFAMNAFYIKELFDKIDPLPFIKGDISRDEYIQKNRSEYAAYQYVNRNLAENVKIFGLFVGNRKYYCDRSIITDENIFRNIARNSGSAENIFNKTVSMGITHFIVGEALYASWLNGAFSEDSRKMVSDFWKLHSRLIFSEYGYSVYEIVH